MMSEGGSSEPLHRTWKHQRKVRRLHHISKEDMAKLDDFRSLVFQLKEEHENLWRKYGIVGV